MGSSIHYQFLLMFPISSQLQLSQASWAKPFRQLRPENHIARIHDGARIRYHPADVGNLKLFPGVIANDHISFDLKYGEIHALLGENGVGKSTLMNILAAMYHPDHGETNLEGRPVIFDSAREAILEASGWSINISCSFQTVRRSKYHPWNQTAQRAFLDINGACVDTEFARQYGMDIDPQAKVWSFPWDSGRGWKS